MFVKVLCRVALAPLLFIVYEETGDRGDSEDNDR